MLSLSYLTLFSLSAIFLFCIWDSDDCDQGDTLLLSQSFLHPRKVAFQALNCPSLISFIFKQTSQKLSLTKSMSSQSLSS